MGTTGHLSGAVVGAMRITASDETKTTGSWVGALTRAIDSELSAYAEPLSSFQVSWSSASPRVAYQHSIALQHHWLVQEKDALWHYSPNFASGDLHLDRGRFALLQDGQQRIMTDSHKTFYDTTWTLPNPAVVMAMKMHHCNADACPCRRQRASSNSSNEWEAGGTPPRFLLSLGTQEF
jgi:hypothetical protein